MSKTEDKSGGIVWILVDHSSREAAFETVGSLLAEEGVETHIVTISEVLGSVARDAISGGAERLVRGLRVAMRGRNQDEDLIGAVRRARPDLLAVTNARYVRALGLLESLTGITSLQVGVFADYDFDPAWTRSSLEAFVVPHASFRDKLVKEGFPGDRVLVGGPAIQARFATEIDRDAEREAMKLGSTTTVLVRAETFETHLLEKLVFQATLVEQEARFVFHHNGDGAVASTLRRAASQYGLKAAMFGRVDDLERYVATADAVIASPRDPFVPEIMALDRPLLLVGPDHGATAQVEFLTELGAAAWVEDVLRLGSELDRFLEEDALKEACAAAAELSQTRGSEEVAEALLTALQQREQWQKTPAPPDDVAPHDDDDEDQDASEAAEAHGTKEEEADNSPFESIGDSAPGDPGSKRTDGSNADYSRISKAEAKDQLAALILTERDIERQLADAEKQQARWRGRLEMAREWDEDDLASEAESILRGYMDEAEKLQSERRSIQRQKEKLKEAALGGAGTGGSSPSGEVPETKLADVEKRFRKMEVDNDLDDLKDRIRRELGD